jgi:Caspase domain
MQQAAVIIGVSQTASNRLQKLEAAISSARNMEKWARAQGFKYVEVLTDEHGPVTIDQIKTVVKELSKKGTIEQLFVYFSGHGVNNHYSEYWLLSDAPNDSGAAVNVSGSMLLAEQCSFTHVVFISDACRTPAEDIQAQRIDGGGIFPNNPPGADERFVDVYYATRLGDPALEIKGADRKYQALYTEVLAKGLSCAVNDCVVNTTIAGEDFAVVKPWLLKAYLEKAVPEQLRAAAVSASLSQIPAAKLCSPPETWLARKSLFGEGVPAGTPSRVPQGPPPDTVSPLMARRLTGQEALARGFISAIEESRLTPGELTRSVPQDASARLVAEAEARAKDFGRTRFETHCGFKVQGATVVHSFSPKMTTELEGGDSVRVGLQMQPPPHPVSVVLAFSNGRGVIIPAIPEFIAGLTFEGTNLVNVVYEPTENSWRWHDYQAKADKLRKLRGKVAAATRHGIFEPTGEGVGQLAREMQMSKSYDPTMALYAAYAYHSIGERQRLKEMEGYLYEDLHLRFFDIAMLAGTFHERPDRKILPATPLLAQGWALLSARQIELPAGLKKLPETLTTSLWSTFTMHGVELLNDALASGEIPQ